MAVQAHDVPPLRLGAFIGEVTFLPADPPRDAAFALWRPAPGFVPHDRVRLWTGGFHGVAAEELEAGLAPVADAIPWLAGQDVLPHQRLRDQAADAASRALDILRGTGDGCLELDRQTDVARIGSSLASPWDVSNLAWRAGMSPVQLGRLIRAWQARDSGGRTMGEGPRATTIEQVTPVRSEQLMLFDS